MQELSLATQTLFKVDNYIDQLVQKIELLSYVNPVNIESEKEKFFAQFSSDIFCCIHERSSHWNLMSLQAILIILFY